MLHTKVTWTQKLSSWLWKQRKICHTQWRDSCWLNLFSVANKRNTCWQKIVCVTYKYKVYWSNKLSVARKILWRRTKTTAGVHKCFQFFFGTASHTFFTISSSFATGLNISTGRRTVSGKRWNYARRKLLRNGHSCPALSFYYQLPTS